MYPILFKIGNFTVYTHGVMAVLGILLSASLLYVLARKRRLETTFIFDNLVYTVLFGILGARLLYYILYSNQFGSVWEIFQLWQGGLVSYGGFIVGGAAFWLILKMQKQPVWRWLDLLAVAFPLGLLFGRIGDLLAGEYAGVASSSKLAVGGFIPVALFEAGLCLLLFLGLLAVWQKFSALKEGTIFLISVAAYTFGRAGIDVWRDEKELIFGLSLGQIAGLALGCLALFLLITRVQKGAVKNDKQRVTA